mmetsp:Transcript_27785/g.65862  ORF Transcript_27785/g.65862 Transcript_27785/m.65862 type:complete len:119 (+) Transcript_27785:948-1304(+)
MCRYIPTWVMDGLVFGSTATAERYFDLSLHLLDHVLSRVLDEFNSPDHVVISFEAQTALRRLVVQVQPETGGVRRYAIHVRTFVNGLQDDEPHQVTGQDALDVAIHMETISDVGGDNE